MLRLFRCDEFYKRGIMFEEEKETAVSETRTADRLEIWRLCNSYTIAQAALLIAGHDASNAACVESLEPSERPSGYEAAKSALIAALHFPLCGNVVLSNRSVTLLNRHGSTRQRVEQFVDVEKSTVSALALRSWLLERGVRTGFFFPEKKSDQPDYLNPNHERYAPKLAAAVHAWQALRDGAPAGKTPKQAIVDWLAGNASGFGLVDKSGGLNSTGIDQIASVANWQPGGGPPKTPGNS
jgi:hypothetical protein